MVKDRNTVVLYTSGVCNLNCRYCGIDKNPVLKDIDKALEESFSGDYYFNQIKKYFPNRGQLRRIETWGGEPFLYMDRIYPTLHKVIEHYPYFDTMFSSTNFSYPTWKDQVFGLLKQFNKYPYKNFNYELQLSCDGPKYINDTGRGEGTTERCLDNFKIFIDELENNVPSNVNLYIGIKPTLDINNLKKLNTKEKIIEYYQFFEKNFIEPVVSLGFSNIFINYPIPNIAVPAPASKQDGIFFANFCKKCKEIEIENQSRKYFKYYNTIMMFSNNEVYYDTLTYQYNHHFCGAGSSLVGLLPDGMVSTCHEGFTYFIEKYKEFASSSSRVETGSINFNKFLGENNKLRYCTDEEGYNDFERQMGFYCEPNTSARLANIVAEIITLAMCGQIEPCYINVENALKAALFLQGHSSYCIKDNYNVTGSITLVDYGMIKLFLNGAMKYIQNEKEFVINYDY